MKASILIAAENCNGTNSRDLASRLHRKIQVFATPCYFAYFIATMPSQSWKALRKLLINALDNRKPTAVIETIIEIDPTVLKIDPDDSTKSTILHHACRCSPLLELESMRVLVKHSPESLRMVDNIRNVPLHYACVSKYFLDVIQLLYDTCPAAVREVNINGHTPLHDACIFGAPFDVIEYLSEKWSVACLLCGENMKIPYDYVKTNKEGPAALHLSKLTNLAACAMVHLLLNKPQMDTDGLAVAHVVTFIEGDLTDLKGNKFLWKEYNISGVQGLLRNDCLQMMLGNQAFQTMIEKLIHPRSNPPLSLDEENSMHFQIVLALKLGCQKVIIERLLSRNSAALEMADVDNSTGMLLLHVACALTSPPPLDIFKLIVFKRPKTIRMADTNGDIPLHCACHHNYPLEFVALLLNKYPEGMMVRNHEGNVPLHIACERITSLETIYFLVDKWPAATLVLNSNEQHSPLDRARRTYRNELVTILLKATADTVSALIDILLCPKIDQPQTVLYCVLKWVPDQSIVKRGNGLFVTKVDSAAVRNVGALLKNTDLQKLLFDPSFQALLDGFICMNNAGRQYVIERPESKVDAIRVAQAVSTNISCLFLHLLENPAICKKSPLDANIVKLESARTRASVCDIVTAKDLGPQVGISSNKRQCVRHRHRKDLGGPMFAKTV